MSAEKRATDAATDAPGTGLSRAATLLLLGAVLGAGVVIFAWMNIEAVPVTVFLWEPEISKALLMFVPLVVGFILGWGLRASRSRKRERKRRERRKEGRSGSGGADEPGRDGRGAL